MKIYHFLLLLFIIFTATGTAVGGDEISLFSSQGKPTAYIAEDLTIYTWEGKPSAYLEKAEAGKGFHIYGFNGTHLGWFVSGVIYDHDGEVVGAGREAFAGVVQFEPFKAFKQFKPFKGFKKFAPLRPILRKHWSDTPLNLFLMQGNDN